MPMPSEHSARIRDPGQYDLFRRKNNEFGPGIHVIYGIKRNPRKSEVQAIRFEASRWTVAKAKAWLKAHAYKPISFEPATGGEEEDKQMAAAKLAMNMGITAHSVNPQLFYRGSTIQPTAISETERTVDVSFSSEAGVQRWYGTEVLLHGVDNVDLGRLNSIGACLLNHNPDQIVGPIVKAELGQDKRGHARIGFDKDEDGQKVFGKVQSGSLRGVSVGYLIHKAQRVEQGEEWQGYKGPALVATRWEPVELSLTPVPADSHVGVGRDLLRTLDGIEIERVASGQEKETDMEGKLIEVLVSHGLDPKANEAEMVSFVEKLVDAPAPDEVAIRKAAQKEMLGDLARIYERAAAVGKAALAMQLATEGKTAEQITDAIFGELAKERSKPAGQVIETVTTRTTRRLAELSDDDVVGALSEGNLLPVED